MAETTNVTGLSAEDAARARAAGESVLPTATAGEWLRHTPVSALMDVAAENTAGLRPLVACESDASVADVFGVLAKEGVSAVPLEVAKSSPGKASHDCFVDTLDVVAALVGGDGEISPAALQTALAGANSPARDIAGAGGRSAFYPVEESAPLLQAVELLVRHRCRRLPVFGDGSADVKTLVTQSNFIRLVERNGQRFANLNEKTVGDLKLGYLDKVFSVKEDALAIEAFRLMHKEQVAAVAVVNAEGTLVGNISATDVTLVGAGGSEASFARLFLTAADFTDLIAGRAARQGRAISGPLAVNPSTTFEEVLAKIAMTNAHRLWVIDPTDKAKLLGVVSIVDILEAVLAAAK